jgi:hypothetical protein
MYWLDSSELAAAAFGLGIAHPPGHPLALLVGKACSLVPLGPVALRMGAASALFGALAAAQAAALGERIAARVREALGRPPAPALSAILGAAAGLLFGLSYGAAFQAVRTEVYALGAFLSLAAVNRLLAFAETHDRRQVYAAALLFGLALTNHHLSAIALVVPAALVAFLWHRARFGVRVLGRSTLATALGLLVYAHLPLRALHHPLVDWGAPSTPARFLWTVSARAFQKSLGRATSTDLPGLAAAITGELHPLGALVLLGGLYIAFRLRETRRLALLLLIGAAGVAATPALVGFDPANPDAYGYLEAGIALLCALACALPAAIAAKLRGAALPVAIATIALATLKGAASWPRVDRSGDHDAEIVLGRLLDGAPPRATLITSYFQTVFGLYYLTDVEGRRPDVDLLHRHFLSYPGYREELLARHPELGPLTGERDIIVPAVAARAGLVEYDLDLDPRLVPRSMVISTAGLALDEPQTRRFAAWQAYLAASRACRLSDRTGLERALAGARALLPDSPELSALEHGECEPKLRSRPGP